MKYKSTKPLLSVILLIIVQFQFHQTYAQTAKTTPWTVELRAGTTKSRIKSFPAPGVTETNLPDKTQKFSLGSFAGVLVGYRLPKQLSVGIGAFYTINRIKYTIPEVLFQHPDSSWENANGKIQNSTHSIYIPVQCTYDLFNKPNTPFFNVGAALNVYRGTIIRYNTFADDDSKELASGKLAYKMEDYNGKNFGMLIGVGYKMNIKQNIDFIAILNYNFTTSRILNKDLNVSANHRINFLQLGIGAVYHFTKK